MGEGDRECGHLGSRSYPCPSHHCSSLVPASHTPAGKPRACQGGPGCLSGFSSLGKKPPYTPLRHPQLPWPGDERGALSHKGSSAPGRGTGSALGNRLQRQTGFLGSHVQGGRGPGKSIPFQELASRRLAPLVTSFVASGTLPNANNSSRRAARFCCKHFAYFKLQATTTVQ